MNSMFTRNSKPWSQSEELLKTHVRVCKHTEYSKLRGAALMRTEKGVCLLQLFQSELSQYRAGKGMYNQLPQE